MNMHKYIPILHGVVCFVCYCLLIGASKATANRRKKKSYVTDGIIKTGRGGALKHSFAKIALQTHLKYADHLPDSSSIQLIERSVKQLHYSLLEQLPIKELKFSLSTLKRVINQMNLTLRINQKKMVTCSVCTNFNNTEKMLRKQLPLDMVKMNELAQQLQNHIAQQRTERENFYKLALESAKSPNYSWTLMQVSK